MPSGWPSGRGFVRSATVSLSLLLGACEGFATCTRYRVELHQDRSLTGGVRIGGWEGRSCVRQSKGRNGEARQPLWLWTDGLEWQTAADRPPACTPGA